MLPPPIAPDDALFLDFDGTIVEIAPTPERVVVEPALPELLTKVASQLDGALAIVSGRPLNDLLRMVQPFHGAAAGIHGIERVTAHGDLVRPVPDPAIEKVRPSLQRFAAATPGVLLEDKGLAIALHFRGNPAAAFICLQVMRDAAEQSGGHLSLMQGKMIIELRPSSANKGKAILDFMNEAPFKGRRPVFVGDDRTDEDGFVVVNRLGGVSVHVGVRGNTTAAFDIPDVSAVTTWLGETPLVAGHSVPASS